MQPFKQISLILLAISSLLVVQSTAAAVANKAFCMSAQEVNSPVRPNLNPERYEIKKLQSIKYPNTWSDDVAQLGLHLVGDFSKLPSYSLSSTRTNAGPAGQYIIVLTWTRQLGPNAQQVEERWIWLNGGTSCSNVDIAKVPTKVEVATINYSHSPIG